MVHLFINRVHLFNIDPNIDYILMLVEQYHEGNCEDKEILTSIRKAVDASMPVSYTHLDVYKRQPVAYGMYLFCFL